MEFLFVLGDTKLEDLHPQSLPLNKYLNCYRCLLETEELGCLLGSDTCLTPLGSSCVTLHIKNSKGTPPPTLGQLPTRPPPSVLCDTPSLVSTALRCSSTFSQIHTSLYSCFLLSSEPRPPTFLRCPALKGPRSPEALGCPEWSASPAVRDSSPGLADALGLMLRRLGPLF
jgi:hypothetical protein